MPKGDYLAKPVTIRGVTYPSIGAAARALNISQGAVAAALRKGKLDTLGLQYERAAARRRGL